MTETSAIGKPRPLIDGHPKVTGALRYAADLHTPGMLYARFLPSVHAHARILDIDTDDALAVPGVVAVLTARDMPDFAPSSRNRLVLARDRVIFVGQPVAVVVADSEAAADDALDRIMVRYEPLPVVSTIEEALAEGAPLVWPDGIPSGAEDAGAHGADVGESDSEEKEQATNIGSESSRNRGDVDAAFAEADVIVERTFTTSMVHQNYLETHGVVVQPDPMTGGATIWSSTQGPFDVRKAVAGGLGVPESDVRVIGTPVGGGFGGKTTGIYELLVALVARAMGRPVRLVLSRMEDLAATIPAPAVKIHLRLGAKRDGTLTAIEGDVLVDAGCYPAGWIGGIIAFMLGSFYPVPNLRFTSAEVLTFKQSVGAYRAPGATSTVFAIDTLMDELAGKLDMDPIEFRLRNAARPGDSLADGKPWPGMGMREVLEAIRDHPAWENRDQARAAGRGVGIAVGGWLGGIEPAAAACGLNRDGTVHIHVGSVDISGSSTGFSLLAAEAFGVSPDKVRIVMGDTSNAPYSGMSAGSKVTYTTGTAVVAAAREARQQVLAIAAEEFEAAVEDLEIVDGKVQVRGVPAKAVDLGELAAKTMQFDGKYPPVFAHGHSAITTQSPGFSAQLAEVEVDQETGEVKVHRLVVAQDVGKAINPMAIEGQMMGGATQGIGWALYEGMHYDDQGQLVTGSWMDYAVPDSVQGASQIDTIIVEVPSEYGPFGARGVGEPPVVPTAAAIANAIADAAHIRMVDLPMTAPRVLKALMQTED